MLDTPDLGYIQSSTWISGSDAASEMDGWLDGWINGWMDGSMDGGMDVCMTTLITNFDALIIIYP